MQEIINGIDQVDLNRRIAQQKIMADAAKQNDPTTAWGPEAENLINQSEQGAYDKISTTAEERSAILDDISKLSTHINEITKLVSKIKDRSFPRNELFQKFRDSYATVSDIWEKWKEKYGYLIPGGEEFFPPLSANLEAISEQQMEEYIERMGSLRQCIQSNSLQKIDLQLQQILTLNELLLKALKELITLMSQSNNIFTRNQRGSI